jgi:4-alpha-glucanotransferase
VAERAADRALEEAARSWGVLTRYEGQEGETVRAAPESVLAALRELGAHVETRADLPGALRARQAELWAQIVEPVVVSWADESAGRVEIRLLAGEARDALALGLAREGGTTEEWSVRAEDLAELRAVEVEGREHLRGFARLPAGLPVGYHQLTVRSGPRHARACVIRAPRRAWTPERDGAPPREWGAFLPLYALRTARSHGVADLTDLGALQEWTARQGGAFVGTLPLVAAFLDRPYDPSPYAPVSRLFWNELYLDPERLPGLERAPATRALLGSADYRAESERLRALPEVRHREAMRHRRRVLEALQRELAPADAALPVELAEFAASAPEAERYAAFRALNDRAGRSWRDWPAHARAGSLAPRDVDEALYRVHLYAQWAMDRQLTAQGRGAAGARAPLYMDLPVGTHPDGFDVWRWRDLFADASAGAPPDAFFSGGQDWGFPPVHPVRARADGHAYWAASLRHLMRAAAMLRLDHVMGLQRLFWIPRGMTAKEGVYVKYPAEELIAVLCLESNRHRTEVVGEDLGTVADEMREAMARHRLRRMYVVPFELDGERGELAPEPAASVASLNTHDTAPFRAWIDQGDNGADLSRAVDAPADAPDALLRGALVRLAEGPARLVLVSLEDLWLETEPQNRPGTPGTENWNRKARVALDEMDGIEGLDQTLAAVDRARRAPPRGRAAPPTARPVRVRP